VISSDMRGIDRETVTATPPAGGKAINYSDMTLMPDPASAAMDPFEPQPTVVINCDIHEPSTGQAYDRDPRALARRAEAYLQ